MEPLKLRTDEPLEVQLLSHLAQLGAASGDYELKLREAGRIVTQATVTLRVRPLHQAEGPGFPGVAPAGAPVISPVVPPVTSTVFAEVGERIVRDAVERHLGGPDEDDGEEEEAPMPTGAAGLLALVVQSPQLSEALAKVLEAGASWMTERTRLAGARATLYERRASSNATPPSPVQPSRPAGKVVGFVRKGGPASGTGN
ncbi:hypothetical protein [Myxococcus stipitatus]|uniref:hypothetical protein n=1 Tax=Myxococcus stipitatus TaxID=83455 RepID=UPI0030CC5462